MLAIRAATLADLEPMRVLMDRAIGQLQGNFLDWAEIAASRAVMGLDTQLVRDDTYFVVETDGVMAGCGGWSRRATLYGGDHSIALRDDALLDPACDPARIRAMYTDPTFARRGVGRMILTTCERAAVTAGFKRAEMMATLAGEALYRACGYREIARIFAEAGGVRVPLVRMGKAISA